MKPDLTRQYLDEKIEKSQALLLYFYHDQCAPCISLRPKVEQLVHEEFPLMHLEKIDSLKYQQIAASFGVFSYPTLVLYFEGNEHQRYSKYVSIQQLHEAIDRPYELIFSS